MKKIFTSLFLLLGLVQGINAQEPYAVLSEDNTTLTFYYDNNKEAMGGMDIKPFSSGELPEWNTQRETITTVVFDNSFAECTSITSTASWFLGCSLLSEIIGMSNFKTDNVTDMSAMFYGCLALTTLDLSTFKTDNVINMSNMFGYCLRLKSLDVSNFKTDNVTDMYGMFVLCYSLTSLDISNFKTDNVADMGAMFQHCESLTSLDVSNFKTDNVTRMVDMFGSCESLTNLDISNFNTGKVTDVRSMFNGCTAMTTIYCNDTWTCYYSQDMFNNCTSLKGAISYDYKKTDATYANPDTGYFTRTGGQVVIEGDANGDGKVNVTDIVTEVNKNGGKDNKNINVIVNKIMQKTSK